MLAPVFMIGAALGALEGQVLPPAGAGLWALVGLAAVVGGVMRSPLTGVVFTLELTHAWPALLALLVGSASAYAVSVLLLRRSVLTEKIARRGHHLSREYDVDPLEVLFVDEVMHTEPATLRVEDLTRPDPAKRDALLAATVPSAAGDTADGLVPDPAQRLVPVVDDDHRLLGVVPRSALAGPGTEAGVADHVVDPVLVVRPEDTLRTVRSHFARHSVTAAPVVDGDDTPPRLVGLLTVDHLLDGHLRDLAEEHDRGRVRSPWGEPTRRRARAAPGRTGT